MIYPIIPKERATLSVLMGGNGLLGNILEEGQSHTFPIHGRAETVLSNALLHIASGLRAIRIADHFSEHFDALSSCPCCKLEGRILAGMGRKSPEPSRRTASGGTVQIRRIPLGRSADQLLADDKRRQAAERTKAAMLKALSTPQRRTSVPIEELI